MRNEVGQENSSKEVRHKMKPGHGHALIVASRLRMLSSDAKHRTCKYLNNIIEANHGALKRVIRPTRGFQTMKTAAATMKGFEMMRMIRRGHCLTCKPHGKDEVHFVNKLFDIFDIAA